MNMEFTTLKQISRDKDNSKVKVRFLRMWDVINIANNYDLISLDMILVDKEGTLIHASIRKNLAQNYIGAIEEIKTRGHPTKMRSIQLLLEEYTTMDINVKEILPKGLPKIQDETKDLLVTCNVKIININNKYGWYYVACLICKTKVKQVKRVLWCERCKNEPKFAVPSYRIQVQVQDETRSTTFILFDKGVEKIISKTAKELAKMHEEILKLDENILPKEIQKIIGNEYLFQLHLDE
nr:hypothetical protein CFP56_62819 [Quercus suber]